MIFSLKTVFFKKKYSFSFRIVCTFLLLHRAEKVVGKSCVEVTGLVAHEHVLPTMVFESPKVLWYLQRHPTNKDVVAPVVVTRRVQPGLVTQEQVAVPVRVLFARVVAYENVACSHQVVVPGLVANEYVLGTVAVFQSRSRACKLVVDRGYGVGLSLHFQQLPLKAFYLHLEKSSAPLLLVYLSDLCMYFFIPCSFMNFIQKLVSWQTVYSCDG